MFVTIFGLIELLGLNYTISYPSCVAATLTSATFRQSSRQSKVADFDVTVLVDKYVSRLQVSMDHLCRMH